MRHFVREPGGMVRVAVIGGDGIGPEVVSAGMRVLEAAAAEDPSLERCLAKNIREWLIRFSQLLRDCVPHPCSVRATVVAMADVERLTGPPGKKRKVR